MTTDNGVIRAAQILADAIDRLTDTLVRAEEGPVTTQVDTRHNGV